MNANVGMQYPVYAPVNVYTPGTSITYNTGAVAGEAVSAELSWERADGHFYGDDVELDSDNGILGYTLDIELSGLKDNVRAALLGDDLANSEYTITDEAAPDVGFGYIRVMRDKGTVSYEGWWFCKLNQVFSTRSLDRDGHTLTLQSLWKTDLRKMYLSWIQSKASEIRKR